MSASDVQTLLKRFGSATERLEANLRTAVKMAGDEAATGAKNTTSFKDRSTVLRNSIEADGPHGSFSGVDLHVLVTAGAPYASYVEKGTRPHKIKPNLRKALRWPVEGGFMFAKVVDHPGTKETLFLEHARDEVMPKLSDKLIPQAIELSFIQSGFDS